MSYVIDEYFENLVQQLKHGKLSSGELIQKIDSSELNGLRANRCMLSPKATIIQGIKDDPSFEELCQQAEILLNKSPTLQQTKSIHLDFMNNVSGLNENILETTNNNTLSMKASNRSPSLTKSPYLYISREPLEEIESTNVQSEKLFHTLGKKQFTDKQIDKIRERTTQKRLEQAHLLKQQKLAKDLIEFETHCVFQPQVNITKNKSVKSKYMASSSNQKSPSHKPNCKSEDFTFRPQTTDYKANNTKTMYYLQQNAFSRLSNTSTACQLSTRFASQVTLHTEALLQHMRSISPISSPRSMVSGIETLRKLTKVSSNLNYSPKENTLHTGDKQTVEKIFEKLDCIKDSSSSYNDEKSLHGNTFANQSNTERNLKSAHKEANNHMYSSLKKDLCKTSQEFLIRQDVFETNRKNRISKIGQSVAVSHSPQIEKKSIKILSKKFGNSSNFENRSQYFETKKKQRLENLNRNRSPTFKPDISEYARSLSKERIEEVRLNSQKKAEFAVKNIRSQRNLKEQSELIFHPEINPNFLTESRLGLDKNLSEYVTDLRCKQDVIKNFKEIVDQRRELQETIECTHQPQINEFPYYLAKQKKMIDLNSKNKIDLIDDKYTIIQNRNRNPKKALLRSENIAKIYNESKDSRQDSESQEITDSNKKTIIAKSGGKCGDNTLTLTSEDLFSASHQVIGDDDQNRSRNTVDANMKNELERLQLSEVFPTQCFNTAQKPIEIEQLLTKPLCIEDNLNSPRLPEIHTSLLSFPASPSQGSGKKPPLPNLWKKD